MEKWYYIYLGVEWSIRLLLSALVILRQSRPATALAWLALTMMVPIPSVFLYFMFGEVRLGGRRARKYAATAGVTARQGASRDRVLSPTLTLSPGNVSIRSSSSSDAGRPWLGVAP